MWIMFARLLLGAVKIIPAESLHPFPGPAGRGRHPTKGDASGDASRLHRLHAAHQQRGHADAAADRPPALACAATRPAGPLSAPEEAAHD